MSMKRLSRRSILGTLALVLTISSVSALVLFSQTFPSTSISNPAGLVSNCAPLIAGITTNNGTSGDHEQIDQYFQCTSAGPLVSTSQTALSVAIAGSYIPTFGPIDTSGSTATITSMSLQLKTDSIQGSALWCQSGNPSFILVSGTAIALQPSYNCQNGTGISATNIVYYQLHVVVSSFGTVSINAFSITWRSA